MKRPTITPEWITEGKTTLIHKKGETDVAKNYRPITCLPTYYKLLTLILTDSIYQHLIEQQILPCGQKGIRRQIHGCKDHLMIDKLLTEDVRRKNRSASMMWIDYKRSFPSVPHSWLLEAMKTYKIDNNIIEFIKTTIPTWRTNLNLPYVNGCISMDNINITRILPQGDSLSPLLFCICLFPISNILKRANVGCKLKKKKISNLLYMDDLKLFAKNPEEMERTRKLISNFSKDINMEFNLDKCAMLHINKGKVIQSTTVKDIPQLDIEDNYKYLGVIQNNKLLQKQIKENTTKEYFSRLRNTLNSNVSAKNISTTIKAFVMPIMRYGFKILKWTTTELKLLDQKQENY